MILNKKLILALTLCFAMPLAGCGKNDKKQPENYPDPPKQITQDTCTEDYFNNHPDLAKALYEAEGSPQDPEGPTAGAVLPTGHKITEADVASYNVAKVMLAGWSFMVGSVPFKPYQKKAFDYLNKHGPEKYKKYIVECRNAILPDRLTNPFEPVPNVTNITYPKPSKETCSNKYVNSHPELKKAIGYAFNQLLVEGKSTKKEVEKAEAEAKAKNFQDLDAIADLLKPKALGDFYKNCARYPD